MRHLHLVNKNTPPIRVVDVKNGNVLFRGPRPETLEQFLALPVKNVINLERGWFEPLHFKNYQEDFWSSQSSIMVHHLPLSDLWCPSDEMIKEFIELVHTYLHLGSVFVHCLHGVDRTGFMIACYRIRVQGWSPYDAIKEMKALGFHKFPYSFWIKKLTTI
jgi:protein-tyrosine phosphatase